MFQNAQHFILQSSDCAKTPVIILKDKKVGLVRTDSGFYTEELMSYLESEKLNYIMAVRMYPNVKYNIRFARVGSIN